MPEENGTRWRRLKKRKVAKQPEVEAALAAKGPGGAEGPEEAGGPEETEPGKTGEAKGTKEP